MHIPNLKLAAFSLASLATIVSAGCGTGLINGGQNYNEGPGCFRTGTLWSCGDGIIALPFSFPFPLIQLSTKLSHHHVQEQP